MVEPFLSVEQDKLESLMLRIAEETDARQLKRDLSEQLQQAVEPALPIIRGELMAMGGAVTASPPLRATVAAGLKTKVRSSGASPGVRVSIGRKGMPRGFEDAARRINQGAWLHPIFGRPGSAITQIGAVDFFDRPLQNRREELRKAVEQALDDMAARIAGRAG